LYSVNILVNVVTQCIEVFVCLGKGVWCFAGMIMVWWLLNTWKCGTVCVGLMGKGCLSTWQFVII